jgi:hypothetical protein
MSLSDLNLPTRLQIVMRWALYVLAAGALLALIASPHIALAQDGGAAGVVDTTSVIEYLLSILATVITAGLMWLIRQGASALGINKEAKIIQQLEPMVKQAVNYAERKGKSLASDSNLTQIDIENEKVATAVNHILSQAPKWLKQAGVTPAMVEGWVESLLDTPERDKANAKAKKVAAS